MKFFTSFRLKAYHIKKQKGRLRSSRERQPLKYTMIKESFWFSVTVKEEVQNCLGLGPSHIANKNESLQGQQKRCKSSKQSTLRCKLYKSMIWQFAVEVDPALFIFDKLNSVYFKRLFGYYENTSASLTCIFRYLLLKQKLILFIPIYLLECPIKLVLILVVVTTAVA